MPLLVANLAQHAMGADDVKSCCWTTTARHRCHMDKTGAARRCSPPARLLPIR